MAINIPSVMIIAGEASGDLYGAYLAAELRRVLPDADIRGIGSRGMRGAGIKLLYDSSTWSAIGIAEAVKLIPRLTLALRKLKAHLKTQPPDVLVLIDFGAFNIRVARFARTTGIKALYFIPPGSWHRGADYSRLSGFVDKVVTPFPWSAESLKNHGLDAEFFGHPLLDIVRPGMSREEFHKQFGFDTERPIIGLLPGSRTQEIAHNLPALIVAAAGLLESEPGLQFAVPPAPSVDSAAIAEELARVPWIDVELCAKTDSAAMRKTSYPSLARRVNETAEIDGCAKPDSPVRIKLLPGMAHDVLACSRAAAVTSGTATVEAMILGCPMVIIYRGSRLTGIEYKLLGGRIKFIGMPNIILDKPACPELIAEAASPRRIAESLLKLIPDSAERAKMLTDLSEAKSILGGPGALARTARAVCELLNADSRAGMTANQDDARTN